MSKSKDYIEEHHQQNRENAIRFVEAWAETKLKNYQEPSRAGTPKGDPIGFSKKKYKAVLLMALYPTCLKIIDIAKLAQVSENVLMVWRTQDDFRTAMRKELSNLGEVIVKTIECDMYENEIEILQGSTKDENILFFIEVLPWLNSQVFKPLIKSIKPKFEKYMTGYAPLDLEMKKIMVAQGGDGSPEWEKSPVALEAAKTLIEGFINQSIRAGKMQYAGEMLKKLVFQKLDILADD
jgi:hypothetical protein